MMPPVARQKFKLKEDKFQKPKTPNEKTANKKLQIGETRTHL